MVCKTCTNPSSQECAGCDKVQADIGSLRKYDKCGACGGSGTSCSIGCGSLTTTDYDMCGVCNGNDACAADEPLPAPVFTPQATSAYLTPPVTITVTSATANATIFYTIQENTGDSSSDLVPPNAFGTEFPAGGLVIDKNVTIKAFAWMEARKQSYVTTVVYRMVYSADPIVEPPPAVLPVWAICVIAIGGAIVVGLIVCAPPSIAHFLSAGAHALSSQSPSLPSA